MFDNLRDHKSLPVPLRIGFFTDTYAPQVNGISVSLQLLVQGLLNAGHEVTVFAPRFPGYKDIKSNNCETDICRIPSIRYMSIPPIYVAVLGTPRTTLSLHRKQFDILHAHSPLTIGMLAYIMASTRDMPLIYTYHTSIADYTHYVKLIGKTRFIRWAARQFSAATTNLSDQIVVPSVKFERLLLAQNVKRPIHIIPNGIDLANFAKPKSPGCFRAKLGLSANAQLILSVGRVDPEKNLDFLINAFVRVADKYPDAHLVFAGDGSSRAGLEAHAAESGVAHRIHFLGMVNRTDLPSILFDATLFVSASVSEVHPLSMIEAIAAGLPVVAVADDAYEGMLLDDVNAYLTLRDVDTFANTVCNLLAAPEKLKSFGKNSQKISLKFSIEEQVSTLVNFYRNTLHKTGVRNPHNFLELNQQSVSNSKEKPCLKPS